LPCRLSSPVQHRPPPLLCLAVEGQTTPTGSALRSTHLGIHFLTDADLATAEVFGTLTGDSVDTFAGIDYEDGAEGVPVLSDCPHHLVVRRIALLDEGGDHVCIVTEPVAAHSSGPFEPLRLSQADRLAPAHDNEERNDPPTERSDGSS
jgi:flavin reductase (DIM6/NTAB) family NADH-FMN oxidoreductase RutF